MARRHAISQARVSRMTGLAVRSELPSLRARIRRCELLVDRALRVRAQSPSSFDFSLSCVGRGAAAQMGAAALALATRAKGSRMNRSISLALIVATLAV